VVTGGKDGLLVPPRDPSAIALAVVRLLADADLRARLVQAGQKTADHYSWPRVAQRVLDVYARSGAAVAV
jgi:phosphatidylinositol alpha-mannosyltransferase